MGDALFVGLQCETRQPARISHVPGVQAVATHVSRAVLRAVRRNVPLQLADPVLAQMGGALFLLVTAHRWRAQLLQCLREASGAHVFAGGMRLFVNDLAWVVQHTELLSVRLAHWVGLVTGHGMARAEADGCTGGSRHDGR